MEHGAFNYSRYGVNFDRYNLFIGLVPQLIDLARFSAHKEAISYRKFHVGAAIFAIDPELKKTAIFSAGNRKLTEHCPKYCAEMSIIDQAEAAGMKEAIGIVVAATANKEKIAEVTGKATPTLHPCSPCLEKFENSSLIKPETFVVTIGSDAEVYQVHTVADLQELYGKHPHPLVHDTVEAPAQQHSFNHWPERQALYGCLTDPNAEQMGLAHLSHQEAARIALTATLG